jgi:hypothetical protein
MQGILLSRKKLFRLVLYTLINLSRPVRYVRDLYDRSSVVFPFLGATVLCTLKKNIRNARYQVGFCTEDISTGAIQVL